MGWTEERVEVLKKLWLDGFSASQIAKQLGDGLTRNAVIGKVHRLGLSGRAAPSQPQRPAFKASRPARPAAAVQPAAVRRPEPTITIPPPPAVSACEETGSATVLTLGSHMCKWPIGDPSSDSFSFCGRASNEGPYCVQHARVAYQAAPRKVSGKRSESSELVRSLRRYM
ncbi:GcrA family cell cycle regulator [Caulobacter sp. S45]|uniref:GcrA family cell cycle regulator n=1 Tax=Caulobacter sp. S45 TaxID=1641861 RepID=UPI001575478E|nr:GcrA family cell cycle regulator [Caulobacter sp. S45]